MAFFVAIEGIDGSGKGTQTALLKTACSALGWKTETITFPRYAETRIGPQIGRFLDGQFGPLEHSHPVPMSLMYAAERFESRGLIQQKLSESDLLISDRYVGSNLAHQGARLPASEREKFLNWIREIEYELFQIPRPDLVVVLDLPAEVSAVRVARKNARSYTEQVTDLHESNLGYLQTVSELYRELSQTLPGWETVPCLEEDGTDRSPEQIHDQLRQLILDRIPQQQQESIGEGNR